MLESELKEIFADVVKAPVCERWHIFEVPAELLTVTEVPPIEIRSPQPVKGRHTTAPVDSDTPAAPSPAAPAPSTPINSDAPSAVANAGGSAVAVLEGAPAIPATSAIPEGDDEPEEAVVKPLTVGEPGTVLSPSVPATPSAQSPDPSGDVPIPEVSADAVPGAPLDSPTPNLPDDPKLPNSPADAAPDSLDDPASSNPANGTGSPDARDGLPATERPSKVDPLSTTDRLPRVNPLSATDRLPKVDPLSATDRLPKVDPLSGPSPLSLSTSPDLLSASGDLLSTPDPLGPHSGHSQAAADRPLSGTSPGSLADGTDSDRGADPNGKAEPNDD